MVKSRKMFLIEAIPLTKIPLKINQVLSYFCAAFLPKGSLISVPLGRRNEKAVVLESHQIKGHEMEIKDARYQLRPIKKILTAKPILTEAQIKLALWLGRYYYVSPGIFLKMMLPKTGIKNYDLRIKNNVGQKLILVPTVTQIDSAVKNYPQNKTVQIHSALKSKQLNENWRKIARGEAEIIIGTRLTVFAPFANLKEIIVQDQTNTAYRSWDMFPHYRVHEIAQKLAELFGAKLTLKSELPSVELAFMNPASHPRPESHGETEIIDLRQELRQGNFSIFSRRLQELIKQALNKKQPIILFINRRGLGTILLCRDCGYVEKCSNCETSMAYHTIKDRAGLKPILICHHCGQKSEPPAICPRCQSRRIKTFGIGTEKVEAEAEKLFKNASLLRLDGDCAPKAADQQKIIGAFKQKRADILIGTQIILNADLPKVPLVAIISADTLMHLPDFRSDERLFQTITALKSLLDCRSRETCPRSRSENENPKSGSSIKYEMTNHFIIQTYNPQNKILQLAAQGDFKSFYQTELETRQALNYPPFAQIIKLAFRHSDAKKAGAEAKILAAKLTQQLKNSKILNDAVFEINQAVPAFISKEKGKYVWQIIIKARSYWLTEKEKREELLKNRNKILMTVPAGWEIEVDPETLL
jgi:primosomal protein N' (replication factor Y)